MRCRQSARLTPAPAIRINTSPAFGWGTGRVAGTSISGPPGALISMTVWVAGILASTGRSSRCSNTPMIIQLGSVRGTAGESMRHGVLHEGEARENHRDFCFGFWKADVRIKGL